MARRTKSYNQIDRQASRLIDRAEERYNFGRIDRIGNIRQRYRNNISRYLGGRDLSPIGDAIASQRQIPRRVYMGLNAG